MRRRSASKIAETSIAMPLPCGRTFARHIGGYFAFGPEPRNAGRGRKALKQQPVRHDAHDTKAPTTLTARKFSLDAVLPTC
jgi:hypothetical protein